MNIIGKVLARRDRTVARAGWPRQVGGAGLDLTRFREQLSLWMEGVHGAGVSQTVSAGLAATVGRSGRCWKDARAVFA